MSIYIGNFIKKFLYECNENPDWQIVLRIKFLNYIICMVKNCILLYCKYVIALYMYHLDSMMVEHYEVSS